MADISIQFHAIPHELVAFASQFAEEFKLDVVAMRFFPFEAVETESCQIEKLVARSRPYKRFAFARGKPELDVAHELDFSARNPDHLRLDIGMLLPTGLEQSWLSSRTSDPEALSIWRIAAKRIKSITKAGVIAVNPKTGATSRISSFRYTLEARRLQTQGVVMLPPAGDSILKFE